MRGIQRRWPCRTGALAFFAWLLFFCASVGLDGAHAQTAYVHDANGRIVAVTQSDGTTQQYTYDALGHPSQVSAPVAAGQLAIYTFMPSHGDAGTTVTINGQGFSSAAANNNVNFNGVSATVLTASSSQLVVDVPSGATTGQIGISVGGQSVTDPTPFVVDDTGAPPSITQITPLIAAVGTTITVTGEHLNPGTGLTSVLLGSNDISAGSTFSDTQIQHTLVASDSSGYVTVATPYGQAVSASPVIVLPSGISAANVVSSGFASKGSPVTLNVPAGGQTGAMLFNAIEGDWISLQASSISTTASNINYAVYAPGNAQILKGTVSSASPSIHLPQLRASGTYLVTFTPDTGGAQLTVGYEQAGVLALSTQATVVTSTPGQSKRLLFQATSGQTMTLVTGNVQTSPVGGTLSYAIYTPGQQSYLSSSSAIGDTVNLPALPNTGTYQVIVSPGSGVTGSVQLDLEPGIQDTLASNGQSSTFNGYVAGQNVTITFNANQGDNLELTLSGGSVTGTSGSPYMVNVYAANGTNISSNINCYSGWTCRYPLWNLAAGTYTVIVSPPDSKSSISFNAMLESDILGPALSINNEVTTSLALGQVERLTFNATAGSQLALNVAGESTSNPSGLPVYVNVYSPGTSPITPANAYISATITGSGGIALPSYPATLPTTGTYTVIVSTSGVPGIAQLTLTPLAQAIAVNGTNQAYSSIAAGQSVLMSFNASQGLNAELTLNGVSGLNGSLTINVYDPNGTNVATGGDCYNGWTCRYSLWNLSAGTYTVAVSPPDQSSKISFNAVLLSDLQGSAMGANTPASVSMSLGQVQRLTFNANAGDSGVLELSNVSTSNPSGLSVYVSVYSPNAATITTANAYASFSSTSSGSLSLQNLPASGTYTVVVSTSGVPGSATLEWVPQ